MATDNGRHHGKLKLNKDFPRILTLLRKERGYSQKKVAAELGISQALLSHYEKGIRECGLDFVLRAADYYNVSCDYLLGRTLHRTGAVLAIQDLPSDDLSRKGQESKAAADKSSVEYERRVISHSLNIVFGILKKINSESLTEQTAAYLYTSVYTVLRLLYSSNPENPQDIFGLDAFLFGAAMNSARSMAETKIRYILSGQTIGDSIGVKKEALPSLTLEKLSKEFPKSTPALMTLIKAVEQSGKADR